MQQRQWQMAAIHTAQRGLAASVLVLAGIGVCLGGIWATDVLCLIVFVYIGDYVV